MRNITPSRTSLFLAFICLASASLLVSRRVPLSAATGLQHPKGSSYRQEFRNHESNTGVDPYLISTAGTAVNDYPYKNSPSCPAGPAACPDNTKDPYGFYFRECTSFVAWRMNRDAGTPDRNYSFTNTMNKGRWSNGGNWSANATNLHYLVDKVPEAGAVAQWNAKECGGCTVGHVAYVESVNANGSVNLSEYNFSTAWGYGFRQNVAVSSVGRFIHISSRTSRAVVSTSLRLSQGNGPFRPGQKLDGTFSIANRGNADLVMKNVLIGGRVAGPCANNVCPADFVPPPPYKDITIAPGRTHDYSGTFTPQRNGMHTFSVAYQKSDLTWVVPVESENGTINQLKVNVQAPGVTLSGTDPAYFYASPKKQSLFLIGTRLGTILYCRVRSSTGLVSNIYIPLGQVISGTENRIKINTEFKMRGRYYITAYTLVGQSNELAFEVR